MTGPTPPGRPDGADVEHQIPRVCPECGETVAIWGSTSGNLAKPVHKVIVPCTELAALRAERDRLLSDNESVRLAHAAQFPRLQELTKDNAALRARAERAEAAIRRALDGCPNCQAGICNALAHEWLRDALPHAAPTEPEGAA